MHTDRHTSYRWAELAKRLGDNLAIVDPHHSPSMKLTFRELDSFIRQCAAGLSEMGLEKGEKASSKAFKHLHPPDLIMHDGHSQISARLQVYTSSMCPSAGGAILREFCKVADSRSGNHDGGRSGCGEYLLHHNSFFGYQVHPVHA